MSGFFVKLRGRAAEAQALGVTYLKGLAFVNDSEINWKVVAYTVAGCWLIFAFMLLLGEQLAEFLNPLPILVKGIFGGLVYGYVGSTSGHNVEAIFVYWMLVGLGLSWLLHKSRKRAAIIAFTALLHLVLFALTLFPMMILNGR